MLLRIVPRTATPIVAPTCRIAVIRADPDPLRSADSAPSAAFIAAGIASPSPRPATANQAAENPGPLVTLVSAPTPSPAAITPKPVATIDRAVARGSSGSP